jgi:hypothetical protein
MDADGNETTALPQREGDYVAWSPGVDHRGKAIEDAVILTVRWPSLAGHDNGAAAGEGRTSLR